METYLSNIISSLSYQELTILAVLEKADAPFKAISRQKLLDKSELSIAVFQKYLYRLEVTKTIHVLKESKEHSVYITQYGKLALNKLKGADE
ncbi:hypothetical protein [Radiobacillus sp. PE A8.2]|uniref:hypothetical protein n=1 Tax=Radiobacillus sp. PE A8.2 TaxID=3380349 RepID=UPI0038905A8B